MFSTAILMKPSATSSGERPSPISRASSANASRTASASSGWFCCGSENLREEIRDELADHHVGVGDRERSAAAVAFRSRIGAGAVRADAEARAVEMQDRAAAGRHRVDQHHRRAHAHAGDLGLERALVLAVEMRDVGRGAAHVEADQVREAGLASGLRHADHAARRSGQDRVLALEQLGRGEPARRHHEHRDATWSLADVAASPAPPAPRSAGGSARDRRRPRWCRRGRRA